MVCIEKLARKRRVAPSRRFTADAGATTPGTMRFLGEKPTNWDEELFFRYELRFETPPDEAVLRQLAAAWFDHCRSGPVQRGGWTFSREFAYFDVAAERNHQRAFAHVAKFVRQAHSRIAPLVEAVHLTAAEDFPQLDAGPRVEAGRRPISADYPTPESNPVFDAVITERINAATAERYAALIVPPKPKKLGLSLSEPVTEATQSDYPEHLRALYPEDGMRFSGAPERPRRVPLSSVRMTSSLKLVIAGAAQELPLPGGVTTRGLSAPHPSGRWVALPAEEGRAHLLLLFNTETGEAREVWRAAGTDGELRTALWLTDDCLALQCSGRLLVLAVKDDGEAEVVATNTSRAYVVVPCCDGRVLFSSDHKLFSWNGKKLTNVGSFKIDRLYFVRSTHDRIWLRHGYDAQKITDKDQFFEVTNLEEVLALAQPKPSKKKVASKTPKKVSSKAKPEWVGAPNATRPPAVSEDEAKAARDGWSEPRTVIDALGRWGPEKNPVAARAANADVTVAICLEGYALRDAEGSHKVENYHCGRIGVSPAGTRGYGASGGSLLQAFSRGSDKPEVVLHGEIEKLGDVHDFAAVGEDEVVVLLKKGLAWMRRSGAGSWEIAAKLPAAKNGEHIVAAGGVVAAVVKGAKPLLVLTLEGDKVKKLLADAQGANALFVLGGAIHAVRPSGEVVRLQLP